MGSIFLFLASGFPRLFVLNRCVCCFGFRCSPNVLTNLPLASFPFVELLHLHLELRRSSLLFVHYLPCPSFSGAVRTSFRSRRFMKVRAVSLLFQVDPLLFSRPLPRIVFSTGVMHILCDIEVPALNFHHLPSLFPLQLFFSRCRNISLSANIYFPS